MLIHKLRFIVYASQFLQICEATLPLYNIPGSAIGTLSPIFPPIYHFFMQSPPIYHYVLIFFILLNNQYVHELYQQFLSCLILPQNRIDDKVE
jgi:hypothetical protein